MLERLNRTKVLLRISRACIGNGEVHECGKGVYEDDRKDRSFGEAVKSHGTQVKELKNGIGHIRSNEHAPECDAENDGGDGKAFDPAVGDDKFLGGK